jgi:hypothetical protein
VTANDSGADHERIDDPSNRLSRPLVTMLSTAVSSSSGSFDTDIVRLREALRLALARCLDRPDATWPELVAAGAERGDWDEWRVAGLLAAATGESDPEPEVTLDTLGALADELIHRRALVAGPWEGADRQAAVTSPRWQEGLRVRQLVFATERAMEHLDRGDHAGLTAVAAFVEQQDPMGERFPDLAEALRACAADLRDGAGRAVSLRRLRASLASTPFAASVDRRLTELVDTPPSGQ